MALSRPTAASWMTALAVEVRRLLHGLALWTAIFFFIADGATAIGMRTLFVGCHWWLLPVWETFFLSLSAELRFIFCLSQP